MKKHKLMIKTHNVTGLKYLCYTTSEGSKYDNYKGSGKLWKKHLKTYGNNIKTELLFETENFDLFKKIAIEKSIEFDVVNSNQWANLKIEEGDGGDTVSNKKWITNGIKDRYINNDDDIPSNWKLGRTNCVFNDSVKQGIFGKKADLKKRGDAIREAWKNGKMDKRDHSKCGVKGNLNPSKLPENRKKISEAMKKSVTINGIKFDSKGSAAKYFNVNYYIINEWLINGFKNSQTK